MTLHVEILTPEKSIFKGDVDELIAPTFVGQIAILPNHAPLVSKLAHGELIAKKGASEQLFAVEGGFLEVSNNTVTILADYAIHSEEIETEKAKQAVKRAKELMEKKISQQDFAEAQTQLRRALLELKISERRRHRSHIPTTG